MEIWVGTGNKGKVSEFKLLFEKLKPEFVLKSTMDLPTYSAPPENGQSFVDNARIKAKSMKAMKPQTWVFAEDSGLEVEALGNLPGIHSARYAGPKASDSENTAKLLKMLQIRSAGNRKAQFTTVIVAYSSTGEEIIVKGEMKGSIAPLPKGQHGFGYDPVFIPEGQTQTLAELGPGFKAQHSHRAMATHALVSEIKERI
ncbi:MAG: RdgB/HAM1 family non-canonical purine NTP pyrophosphatase [Proteobacteria bacterium]|jgi:XTP/dITP diphosphohydrolase|nr:RdgB/HAM1 family non-canonical purine NTP pyrophosphatase [Pseudomonadota bacterium]